MRKIAVQRVKDLNRPARRWVESILERALQDQEEVTVLTSRPARAARNSQSCYQIARRVRLIGIVKNAPADLSTNKTHFEGFGGK